MSIRTVAAVVGILAGSPAFAADWHPLEGTWAITAQNYLDPAAGEKPNSHIRFQLQGAAAKALYDAMDVEPQPDACTGGLVKSVQAMACIKATGDGKYECHFSVDIANQSIEYGVAC